MLKKSKNYIFEHKYISIFVFLILVGGIYYTYTKFFSTTNETKYVFGTAKKGILISSVSGTGQVTPLSQIDLKPKASGDIIYLKALAGSSVAKGEIIAKLDTKSVSANVRDANVSLESARLSYDKYKSQNSQEKLLYDLTKSYDTTYSSVNNSLLDIPTILNNLEDLKNKESLSDSNARVAGGNKALDLKSKAESKFYLAESSVKSLVSSYSGLDRKSSNELIQKSAADAYKTTKLLSDAIKAEKDYVDYMYEESGRSTVYLQLQTSLGGYASTINSDMSSLLSSLTSIQDSTNAFGDTALGVKSSSLSIKERQNALKDAQDKLEDYIVRAPFSGLIAKSDAKVGDSASVSTVVATLITKQKIAEISLNEVDVAKVKVGQKVTLTFDAISDFTVAGEVSEIDLVGTVSQGVVTYNVKITFDTGDERVKPGMSVSASIITDTKADILLVPNAAVKGKNGTSYVETSTEAIANGTSTTQISLTLPLVNKNVEVGLSNEDYTEIISGLNEGDRIIVRTVSAAKAKTTTSSTKSGIGGGARMPGL